jgi:hypothetical protein
MKRRTKEEEIEYESVVSRVMIDLSSQIARTVDALTEKYGHAPERDAVLHGIAALLFDGVRRFSKNYAEADSLMRRLSRFLVDAIKKNPGEIGVNLDGDPVVKLTLDN